MTPSLFVNEAREALDASGTSSQAANGWRRLGVPLDTAKGEKASGAVVMVQCGDNQTSLVLT